MKSEKVKRLNCRVSEDEYKRFEKKVEKSKLTKSEFMRKAILEKEIEPAQMTGILKTPELNQQIDTEDLAEKVVEKLSLLFKDEKQKGQNDGTGWGAFFS